MKTQQKNLEEITTQAVAQIMEHADSVQILVTVRDAEGDTGCYADGGGNFYARLGHTREWLLRQEAMAKAHAVNQASWKGRS